MSDDMRTTRCERLVLIKCLDANKWSALISYAVRRVIFVNIGIWNSVISLYYQLSTTFKSNLRNRCNIT